MPKPPMFNYFCASCGSPAKKKPLRNQKDWQILEPNEFSGLGGWRCTGRCKGSVKVTRQRVQTPVAELHSAVAVELQEAA